MGRSYEKLKAFGTLAHQYGALVLIGISLLAFLRYPLADCFACEGEGHWGRNEAVYQLRSSLLGQWAIFACLLAGFAKLRWSWTVPVGVTFSDALTHPLAGVSLFSWAHNEGPITLLIGLPFLFAIFLTALILRILCAALFMQTRRLLASNL